MVGDDPEIMLEIRNSAIQAFSHKHLKGLISPEILDIAIAQTEKNLHTYINKAIEQRTGLNLTEYGQVRGTSLTTKVVNEIASIVESLTADRINRIVREKVDAFIQSDRATKLVALLCERRIEEEAEKLLDAKLSELQALKTK